MTTLNAKRAPFTWTYTEEYMLNYGKLDRRREWIDDGFARVVIDQYGEMVQLLRAGINADELIDEMNYAAAMLIMAEGSPAINLLKQE